MLKETPNAECAEEPGMNFCETSRPAGILPEPWHGLEEPAILYMRISTCSVDMEMLLAFVWGKQASWKLFIMHAGQMIKWTICWGKIRAISTDSWNVLSFKTLKKTTNIWINNCLSNKCQIITVNGKHNEIWKSFTVVSRVLGQVIDTLCFY